MQVRDPENFKLVETIIMQMLHLIHKRQNARKSLGWVHESEASEASLPTKAKQSMGECK